jgi:uncharacterized membrane protein HdeD (DUF308 family)
MKYMNDIIARFTSRKFLLAVLGVVAVFFVHMSQEQIIALTVLIGSFTVAEGAADVVTRYTNIPDVKNEEVE